MAHGREARGRRSARKGHAMTERSSRIESTTMTAVVALMALFPLLGRRDPALSRVREAPSLAEGASDPAKAASLYVAPSWVDPLEASLTPQKDALGEVPRAQPAAPWSREPVAPEDPPRVLVVTVPDGTTDIDAENRRRARYALATAMTSLHWSPGDDGGLRRVPCVLPDGTASSWVFERYEKLKGAAGPGRLAAVVWMRQRQHADRSLLRTAPLAAADVLRALTGAEEAPPHTLCLIGPEDSDALVREFTDEKGISSRERDELLMGGVCGMYSPWSTLSQAGLIKEVGEAPATPWPWAPMLIDDDRCVLALVEELVRRGFDPAEHGHRLAVVSDAGTAYGRRMTQAVQEAVDALAPHTPGLRPCVESHGYFSQIDGVWRKDKAPAPEAKAGAKADAKSEPGAAAGGPGLLDGSRGSSQKDYLRRLVRRLVDRDQEDLRGTRWGRLREPRHGRVFAVLVMAADPFDKMLLLEAIRAQMPNVVVAALDLDAEMMHRKALPFTRNTLVASTYGLDPTPEGPVFVAPFRDQYQTAVFHAVRRAMDAGGAADAPPADPRLCEISTAGPRWFDPWGAPLADDRVGRWVLALLAAAGTALVAVAGWRAAAVAGRLGDVPPIAAQKTAGVARWALLGAAALSLIPALMLVLGGAAGAEPMAWADGTSAWPSVVLKSFVAVCSLAFMLVMWARMSLSASRAVAYFRLPTAAPPGEAPVPPLPYGRTFLDLVQLITDLSRLLVSRPAHQPGDGWIDAESEGRRFLLLGRLGRRLRRSCGAAFIYCALFLGVWVLFALDYTPASIRDPWLRAADAALGLPVWFASTWMLFFLIDATLLTASGIARLASGVTRYRDESLRAAALKLGIHDELAGGALDLTLIARAGQAVADLAYVPVLLLLLLMAAQARAFDNWSWNLPVLLSFGLGFGMIVLSGFVLRQSAESARRLELMRLDQVAPGLRREGKVVQADVDRVRGYIQGLDSGPYASFSEQPFFRIVFLPLSGAGIYGLVDLASRMMA